MRGFKTGKINFNPFSSRFFTRFSPVFHTQAKENPMTIYTSITDLIGKTPLLETVNFAKSENLAAKIIAKCNSLCDRKIILALYEASCAGVQVDLIVRGICCLVAGKPGVSENIRVRSIVGTFLEHARIFYFYNDGHEEIYMGSADWMPRNLDRRVEIVFPVEEEELKEKAKHILDVQLSDTLKAHRLLEDGTYQKVDRRGKEAIEAQKTFCEEAIAAANESKKKVPKKRTFDPRFSPQEE